MPERIQLSRAKGWRIPRGTMKVDRSTAYGNPFRAGMYKGFTADDAVTLFRRWMAGELVMRSAGKPPDIGLLRGKNLACWCKPGAPCHADVLLELANTPAGVQGNHNRLPWDAQPGCYSCGRRVDGPCTNTEGCEHPPAPAGVPEGGK